MKRLLILLVLLSVLVGGSSALSQRFDIGQCSYEAWYFADLPVLPDGRYPVHGMMLWGYPPQRQAELIFFADPDRDGCFRRYKAAPQVVVNDLGGQHVEMLVWWIGEVMHIYLPSDQAVWDN